MPAKLVKVVIPIQTTVVVCDGEDALDLALEDLAEAIDSGHGIGLEETLLDLAEKAHSVTPEVGCCPECGAETAADGTLTCDCYGEAEDG